jgi:2,3-bisphosphoglycerate-dependent phosphoglycerate mutase
VYLTLVRHGEPERSPLDPRDPGLGDRGRVQAHATKRVLRADRYDAVYSSPLRRALQTARIVAGESGRSIVLEPGLVEFDYGADYVHYDGASNPVWRHYLEGDLTPWGLTAADFHQRIFRSMQGMIERHRDGRVLAICHGGVINAWTCQLLGVPDRLHVFDPQFAALNRYFHDGRAWHVVSLNESAQPALDK